MAGSWALRAVVALGDDDGVAAAAAGDGVVAAAGDGAAGAEVVAEAVMEDARDPACWAARVRRGRAVPEPAGTAASEG